MFKNGLRLRAWQIVMLASLTAACTAGAGVGPTGSILAAIAIAATLLAACSPPPDKDDVGTNDTGVVDGGEDGGDDPEPDFGVCLSPPIDAEFGPCLTPLPPDMGTPDDAGGPSDMEIERFDTGPCLSPPAPDFGLDPGDAGTDVEVGARIVRDREEILARLEDRLPSDVTARLRGGDHDGSEDA